MDNIDAEIDSGHVDEVGGIVVITVHCGQTSARGGALCNGSVELRRRSSSRAQLLSF